VSNIPFLDNLPASDNSKSMPLVVNKHTLDKAKEAGIDTSNMVLDEMVTALGVVSSPDYINPKVFVADPISKNLNRYVRPNPVSKIKDAAFDLGWNWKFEGYKAMVGIPIRNQVIQVAIIKKQPILCRVKGHRKHVFIIDPKYAQDVAEELKSYQKIYGSDFSIIPIAKFKKVAYS